MSGAHGSNCYYLPMRCREEVTFNSAIKYSNMPYLKIVNTKTPIARVFVISQLCARRLLQIAICITKNCDWSRNITPLSDLARMGSREMKTYRDS